MSDTKNRPSPKEQLRQADRAYMAMLIKQARAKFAAMSKTERLWYVRRLEDEAQRAR